jgi:hypothetical protein
VSKLHIDTKLTHRRTLLFALLILFIGAVQVVRSNVNPRRTLSADFTRQVLAPVLPEAPLELRLFTTAVKTDSQGRIITGPTSDPVKNLVGAEAAGLRAGIQRFTKILFAADYFNGRPDPGQRIDPNRPSVSGGSKHWPFVKQPFRSWPNSLALTPDSRKL